MKFIRVIKAKNILSNNIYGNLKAIVYDINKILTNGAHATLKHRVPQDLKEDGVDFIIEIKNPNNCLYQWGIYPNNKFLLCNSIGNFETKLDNKEGHSSSKFVNDIFEKYGYSWINE